MFAVAKYYEKIYYLKLIEEKVENIIKQNKIPFKSSN